MNARMVRPKPFTAAAANRTLPLVKVIVADIVELHQDVLSRNERLEMMRQRHQRRSSAVGMDSYREEVDQIEHDLQADVDRLNGFTQELENVGAILKNPTDGTVDFPAIMNGEPAFLTWRLGEPAVSYWHQADESPELRQPLEPPAAAEDATDPPGKDRLAGLQDE